MQIDTCAVSQTVPHAAFIASGTPFSSYVPIINTGKGYTYAFAFKFFRIFHSPLCKFGQFLVIFYALQRAYLQGVALQIQHLFHYTTFFPRLQAFYENFSLSFPYHYKKQPRSFFKTKQKKDRRSVFVSPFFEFTHYMCRVLEDF